MISIRSEKVSVVKENESVLDSLDFSINQGSITGLLGPSGSGKTTLMRAIVGVQKLSSGALTVLGEPAGAASLRRKIGYVTQAPAVYKDLTVKQNLSYFAALTSSSRDHVNMVIKQVQLEDYKNRLIQNLSGGQRARVSLGIALLGNPELLVLDEPTVGLDPLLRRDLWALFRELAKSGKTLLISSHVMDEAERCDDILLLRSGQLLWQGSREKLLSRTNEKTAEGAFIQLVSKKEIN